MPSDGIASAPLEAAEFAALMQPFAPFEPAPRLAVAVSGGGDSLALTLLADRWARQRGGTIAALTVDHRLRQGSAAEAAQVGAWLALRGIDHHILVRDPGDDSRSGRGVQATARAARYRLLEGWCAAQGVLHLLVAHHREDQAETVLLRLAHGSGLDGLAGMAPVVERTACRLLRPLLGVARERLLATLAAAGQSWIEDPSNEDTAYARVRMRRAMPPLALAGLGAERLCATAARLGRSRAALEAAVAALLARSAQIHPAGFVRLDPAALAAAPEEIGTRALAALLAMVGGAYYPPRRERLDRLYCALPAGLGGGRTLGGCRVLPRRGGLLICREPAAVAPPVPAPPGATVTWDGRFRVRLSPAAPPGLTLGALGAALSGLAAGRTLPAAVRASLPALYRGRTVVAVPGLSYLKVDGDKGMLALRDVYLRPTRPLTGAGFTVV